MKDFLWADNIDGVAITVCDTNCDILYMNALSRRTFCPQGGTLAGKNLRQYHNERSNAIITELLERGTTNQYTIEKAGVHKLIKQTVWRHEDGTLGGLVEFAIVTAPDMPHHNRG